MAEDVGTDTVKAEKEPLRPAARLAQSVAAENPPAAPVDEVPDEPSPTVIMRIQSGMRFLLLAGVLLMVAVLSMLTAMRFAIHGREVAVPKVIGMRPEQAESMLADKGLVLVAQDRFYSSEVPEGRLMTQAPPAGNTVRRGYKIRAAISLGPQRAVVPALIGESGRAAEINVQRRGLDVGTVAVIHVPDFPPDQVIAQSPTPNARTMESPKVGLLISAPAEEESYIMPDFVGKHLADASWAIQQAGMTLSKVEFAGGSAVDTKKLSPSSAPIVIRQSPPAGSRVTPASVIILEINSN